MKEIQLTQGKIALVDDEDFEYLNQFNWYVQKFEKTCYAERMLTIAVNKRRKIKMHREILGIIDDPTKEGDHRDHNGLNNQRCNLRIATKAQNVANTSCRKNAVSRFLGVSFDKGSKRWRAQIQKDRIKKNIGRFSTEEEAALAYNKKAIEYFGEFANLNKVAV